MYRCIAQAVLSDEVRSAAAEISSPVARIEWASGVTLQCKLEDVPHDHHAAFLRTGASLEPCTDVYLCWFDGTATQWLEDIEVCLKRKGTSTDTGCTIFRDHPGRCDWAYIDPPRLAVEAQADQLERDVRALFQGGAPWSPNA
ncbi:hypothetical protein [Streptomyces nogalater]|uniref:Uncharacterized protein n=1 Tax=Streptomyces nogalater TaxID=38314 RepID=A0ABW0WAT8_STRNO